MKTIVLSDHTGDMIAMRERQHNQGYEIEMARFRSESADLERRIEEEYESRMSAYRGELVDWNALSWRRKFIDGISKWPVILLLCFVAIGASIYLYVVMPESWTFLMGIPVTLGFMALFFPTRTPRQPSRERIRMRWLEPEQPERGEFTDEERVWQAGNEGERRVVAHLSSLLNDDWTLISGYRGPGGEIDQILVGPRGVCALETKYLNGTVFVREDAWKLDKYDNYGNRVESDRPIEDRRGRSPSEQINGAVKPLERFLSRRKLVKDINRAVILTHDKSRVGRVERKTVDYVGTLADLNVDRLYSRQSSRLSRDSATKVVSRIQGDHDYHRKRSRSNRPRRYGRRRR